MAKFLVAVENPGITLSMSFTFISSNGGIPPLQGIQVREASSFLVFSVTLVHSFCYTTN